MGMGHPVMGIIALVAATALLVWVSDKPANPSQGVGKAFAWIAIVLSALLLIGQLYICTSLCIGGNCSRGMGMGRGMGMMQNMMQGPGPGMDMQKNMPHHPPEPGAGK